VDNFDMDEALGLLAQETVQTTDSLSSYQQTSAKNYRNLLQYLNVTSFSQLDTFHRCPRKFQLGKERAAFNPTAPDLGISNVDFSFGHAVGAGIQSYLETGDQQKALFNCIMAWRADFNAAIPKKRKTLWNAMIAVEKFCQAVMPNQLEEWELLVLPSGKPAIEVSFSFHCGNGFKHYGHMDIALRNKRTKYIMVVDCKTTGFTDAEESLYSNSTQALSYAVMLETCLPEEIVEYDVMYLVYSSTEREWTPLSFTKTVLEQAEWIKDLLLTHDMIKTYADVNFFPKRGNACYEYFRRCEFYGECNLTADKRLPELADSDEAEQPHYTVDLQSVIAQLQARRKA
jgi:hypothetical protein